MTTVPTSYKAFFYNRVGPLSETLELRQISTEPLPASHVRIRVHSAALNPSDFKTAEIYGGKIFGTPDPSVEHPYRVGYDVAGVIVEVARDVDDFQIGDEVYASSDILLYGSLAEYFAISAKFVAPKPKNLDFDHAAAVPLTALTSYQALLRADQGNLQPGQRVLILGGSSGCGQRCICDRHYQYKNVEVVKSLGADEVIDYRMRQWADVIAAHSVDLIYDCGFEPESWADAGQRVLKKNTGRFVTLTTKSTAPSKFGATNSFVFFKPLGHDLVEVAKLIEAGKVKPVIDSVFPLEKALDAFARLKTGRVVGKVVIKVL